MTSLFDSLRNNFQQFGPTSGLDVAIISLLFFWLLMLLRGTTAMSVMRGVFILLLAAFALGRVFDLRVLNYLIRNSFTGLLIALPIIFQPEIRRALERVGRTGALAFGGNAGSQETLEAISAAANDMARRKFGALIVLERDTGLQDYVETGIAVDAIASPELIEGIFYPNSPLHDGAIVLRGNRVIAAGCTLPLSENSPPGELGTRHRAGLGITERTDAVSLVVSEETGRISLAADGRMYMRLDDARLRSLLETLLHLQTNGRTPPPAPTARPAPRAMSEPEAEEADVR
ncbi:MAG: TIGR00159 family protein [Dehalococcoidia bacterium]|nr:TIGR00159 family protein [Dehalococcoidia bacterium]